ncbi:PstS family phosphate ABC transporter substrate-binding protein [Flavobacterium pallidum]|uniref:Phosphate ABC transporter substrate-binding protein n=1 Tax=Flavobacterium pallidum TaxID=2172098 RepID=A0A2S1SGJ7_9FLAO|nr:substrate-binding domain-containing protein [Flavobacterium pallidum]AWI25534.1 phosphate ABC transporter substrate-binding protein [Flavobacterium pallidum]
MKYFLNYRTLTAIAFFGLLALGVVCCKRQSEQLKETILEGTATFYVDESILPIVEEELAVFQSEYKAKINLVAKPESEVVNALLSDKTAVVILSRNLSETEKTALAKKQINPKITPFATDAVAFITNKKVKDTLLDLQEAVNLMQGKSSKIKKLVFENPNSGTVNAMNRLAKTDNRTKHEGVYSMNSAVEVMKYVTENTDAVGVVGLNVLLEPDSQCQDLVGSVKVMAVRNVKNPKSDMNYYKPNQSNLALGLYPLRRDLHMLNFQGSAGLGMGFASFIAGERGQRIILKSGLLPVRIPSRNITIRKEINTK